MGEFNRTTRIHHSPSLPVHVDFRNAICRLDQQPFDLLWRSVRIRLEHAGHD
jgi:hypothetical protein